MVGLELNDVEVNSTTSVQVSLSLSRLVLIVYGGKIWDGGEFMGTGEAAAVGRRGDGGQARRRGGEEVAGDCG
jgi:hypothetical protein